MLHQTRKGAAGQGLGVLLLLVATAAILLGLLSARWDAAHPGAVRRGGASSCGIRTVDDWCSRNLQLGKALWNYRRSAGK